MKWVDSLTLTHFALAQRVISGSEKHTAIEFGGDGTIFQYPPNMEVLITDKKIQLTHHLPTKVLDFDTHFSGLDKYELAICFDALYYANQPLCTLNKIVGILEKDGDLLLSLPWFYPHHDLKFPQWRIHPNIIQEKLVPLFENVTFYPLGNMNNLLKIYLNRYIRNKFDSWPEASDISTEVLKISRILEVGWQSNFDVSRHSPLWYYVYAKGKK